MAVKSQAHFCLIQAAGGGGGGPVVANPVYNSTSCSVNNGNCEHQCRYTEEGRPECICEKGSQLAIDRHSCVGSLMFVVVFVVHF